MVNPDDADTAKTDLHNGHGYSAAVAAEPVQSQAGSAFHIRHPFPFSTAASQLPTSAFPRPPDVAQCLPAPVNPGNVFDGGFNPSPFGGQFPGDVSGDWNILPDAGLYQTNVDVGQPAGMLFDNFSSLFRVMPPVSTGNSPNYRTSCQPMSYMPPSSTFMSRADGARFGSQSSGYSSSHPWPPPPDVHRPPFRPLSRFPLAPHKASVEEFCGALLHNSAVGSDSLSSGSPITDLLDHGSSPTQLPGAAYGCAVNLPSSSMSDLVESARQTVAVSPFCASPVDSLQLSRSLPSGVRFGRSPFAGDPAAAAVHHPASRMHFDVMSASSPISNRSSYQPGSFVGGLDDRTAAFQVFTRIFHVYLYSFCYCYQPHCGQIQ